ncbi:MAG: hypothetical protein IPJ40_20795 [Saprospirales bacterium]|nr:hypothetical protein [Saprospirales bacterium]
MTLLPACGRCVSGAGTTCRHLFPAQNRCAPNRKPLSSNKPATLPTAVHRWEKPENRNTFPYPHVEARSFLDSTRYKPGAILESHLILSRSGHSTIMDLAVLNKKALLVSTPGQPEQEYLAQYGLEKGWYYTQTQDQLDLKKGLEEADKLEGIVLPEWDSTALGKFLEEWLA